MVGSEEQCNSQVWTMQYSVFSLKGVGFYMYTSSNQYHSFNLRMKKR